MAALTLGLGIGANVANLLFARAEARRREIALRAGLGASRRRLVAQLLSESVLLAALGGGLGLLAAVRGLDALLGLYPGNLPRAEEVVIDRSVLLFSAALSTASGVLFGIVPALRGTSFSMHDALKADERSTRGWGSSARLRRLLVVCEVAASLALLIGAGLLMRSFGSLWSRRWE